IFVAIGGDIPPGSGLSSSSALVCGAFLCALKAFTGQAFDLLDRSFGLGLGPKPDIFKISDPVLNRIRYPEPKQDPTISLDPDPDPNFLNF
uniref:GHMP kinase N-terminal domain-containing protein n=1 Tax=Romanomermis culicivorax TaxID=13658 RepID=A0A915ITB9_ROMCU